jgi:Mn-dependent DtxR family transcriptional regulator
MTDFSGAVEQLKPLERKVLLYVQDNVPTGKAKLSTENIAECLETSSREVSKALLNLERLGFLKVDIVAATINPFGKRQREVAK